ncbi:hypothetical protein [Gordonia amicalis]|uniref:hypothetical protein n=1 Tax=Gordonia amicalis TaxID=89053 RepID=UPI0015F64A6A|nr:hypothetical protein [Gordonia amicalis]MBA5846328.1 hypothetical protein [Gordonia amicalis]
MVENAGVGSREEYRIAAQRIEEIRAAEYAAEIQQTAALDEVLPSPQLGDGRTPDQQQMTSAQRAAAIASRGVPRTSPVAGTTKRTPSHGVTPSRRESVRPRDANGPSR